jgi:hypothetical protein
LRRFIPQSDWFCKFDRFLSLFARDRLIGYPTVQIRILERACVILDHETLLAAHNTPVALRSQCGARGQTGWERLLIDPLLASHGDDQSMEPSSRWAETCAVLSLPTPSVFHASALPCMDRPGFSTDMLASFTLNPGLRQEGDILPSQLQSSSCVKMISVTDMLGPNLQLKSVMFSLVVVSAAYRRAVFIPSMAGAVDLVSH